MSNQARHHHYIPQGYLRGFARNTTGQKWYVYVNDLRQKRSFAANVRNICGERDFMRADIEGHPPDKIESEMSKFEAQCIDAIRRLAVAGEFLGDDAICVLNLMALLAVRSPEMRENMRDFQERTAKVTMRLAFQTKERYESQLNEMRQAGQAVNDAISFEEMKDFIDRDEYSVTVSRERHIGIEFDLMNTVLNELVKRRWTIYVTDSKTGDFLTTNRPVTLSYIDPSAVPNFLANSPGFALPNTEVFFPMTRHTMLVGRWEEGEGRVKADAQFVGIVNRHMVVHSGGMVLSRDREVSYLDQLLKFRRDDKLLERFTIAPTEEEFLRARQNLNAY